MEEAEADNNQEPPALPPGERLDQAGKPVAQVWDHFESAPDKQSAKCKLCKKIIKTKHGGTSGLHTHLRSVHKILTTKKTNPDSSCKEGKSPHQKPLFKLS